MYIREKNMLNRVSKDMFNDDENSCYKGNADENIHKGRPHDTVLLAAAFGIGTLPINIIKEELHAGEDDIKDIKILKKGMTNRSFLFSCRGKKYIMRLPGEGTDMLINRVQEAAVYDAIKGKEICDNVIYINPENGYKISEFIEGARACSPDDNNDVEKCMKYLRRFHEMKLSVDHEFDIFKMIEYYESLWDGNKSAYDDYEETKSNVLSLKKYIDKHVAEKVLAHIDAVPDNFLFTKDREGRKIIRLIDWEYSGMQDPHVDIAMFCIYSLYDRKHVDSVIDMYFRNDCHHEIRIKIYCYIAACGLLWSNWCEYKRDLGVEFGEYALRQYQYAKEYYNIVQDELAVLDSSSLKYKGKKTSYGR